ncbi:MAG: hypothetical protein JXA18_08130 [Chitinispirillaceae bacterium]|nr:hypothetical protein [Chitinispirillaceae bacterium]
MKKLTIYFIAFISCLLTCVPVSLFPIFNDDDLVFKPALIGVWKSDLPDLEYNIRKSEGTRYVLTITGPVAEQALFNAYLVKLDTVLLLDILPIQLDTQISQYHFFHYIPVHSFYLIRQIHPRLVISSLSIEWMERQFEAGTLPLDCKMMRGYMVLTASTVELQSFIRKAIKIPDAFTAPAIFRKVNIKNNIPG